MADPYFWTQRPCDGSIKDITNFAGGGSPQGDSDSSPHTIKDLDLGKHDLYVSDGQNGTKRGPTPYKHETSFGRTILDDFSPRVLCDLGFVKSNPVLTARNGSGTNADFKRCEINDGNLASHANGGDATLEKWPDKSGTGNDLTPSSTGDGPDVVQGGSLVQTAGAELTADYASPDDLTVSLADETAWTLALEAKLTANAEVVATVDGAAVETDGSNVFVQLGGTQISSSSVTYPPANTNQRMVPYNGELHFKSNGEIYAYDPVADSWSTKSTSAPGFTSPTTLTVWKSKLTIIDSDNNKIYQYDGSWSQTHSVSDTTYDAVGDDTNLYAILRNGGSFDKLAVISPNGSSKTHTFSFSWRDFVVFNDGVYFGVSDGVVRWTGSVFEQVLSGLSNDIYRIGTGGGVLVGVFGAGAGDIKYSTDGTNWQTHTTAANELLSVSRGGSVVGAVDGQGKVHLNSGGGWQQTNIGGNLSEAGAIGNDVYVFDNSNSDADKVSVAKDKVSVPYTTGNEHSVVVGFDGSTLALNVDGTEDTDPIDIGRTSTDKLVLSDSGNPFTGTIRQVGLVPKLATASERNTIAQKLGS